MKPDNAIKLPTDADLSEASLEAALDIIQKKLSKSTAATNYGWLTIPSQSLGQAVLLTKYNNFAELAFSNIHISIEISAQYDVDEWSVTVNNWSFEGKESENNPITVWTKGA
jgi:hypothetical protein